MLNSVNQTKPVWIKKKGEERNKVGKEDPVPVGTGDQISLTERGKYTYRVEIQDEGGDNKDKEEEGDKENKGGKEDKTVVNGNRERVLPEWMTKGEKKGKEEKETEKKKKQSPKKKKKEIKEEEKVQVEEDKISPKKRKLHEMSDDEGKG